MLAAALPILGALGLDVRATMRNTRWQQRRRRVLAERWSRDDAAYHAELARAAREMPPVVVSLPRATFHHYSGYSVKVRP